MPSPVIDIYNTASYLFEKSGNDEKLKKINNKIYGKKGYRGTNCTSVRRNKSIIIDIMPGTKVSNFSKK